MPAKQSRTARRFDPPAWVVLGLVLDRDAARPYTVAQIARKVGGMAAAAEALEVLEDAGLVERIDAFVRISAPHPGERGG